MDKLDEIKKEVKRHGSIAAVSTSEGGKLLVSSLQTDITSTIHQLTTKYQESPHMELVAIIARLKEQLNLLKVLNRAPKLKKMAIEDLDFLLKE